MSNAATASLPLDSPAENSDRVYLNPLVWLQHEQALCVMWVHYAPWHRFVLSSELDRRIVGANLVMAGLAKTVEVVEALGMSRATLHRDRQRLAEGGLPAVAQIRKGPKAPTKAKPQLRARARRDYRQGESKSAIAQKLGVSEATIRGILRGEPSPPAGPEQAPLLEEVGDGDAWAEPCQAVGAEGTRDRMQAPSAVGFEPLEVHPSRTSERDLERSAERVWARFGLITEASVRFVGGQELPFVGALLIVPALVAQGFFAGVQASYGKLKNGFYGLRHTVMTLCLMLALRITRAEHLSGVAPAALGRLLGLDRAPEVKTLRRRVHEIAKLGQASALMRWLAARLAENDAEALDFVLIDGHVRAYFGKRRLSKAYVTQRRLAMPAVSDFWVNDARGEPLLVVTGEVSASLTGQLLPLLEEVRALLGEGQRATVVFDRGGWSPQLFRQILDAGFDVLTYRKGKAPRYPARDFAEHRLEIEGRTVSYRLRDGRVRPGAKLQLRCVVRLGEDGKQTHVVTSRRDLPAAEVAYRMFERWRQENGFKHAGEELDLDALDTYELELADPERSVPNAQRTKLEKAIAGWRKKAKALEAQLGRAIDTDEKVPPASTQELKRAHSALRAELALIREKLAKLIAQRQGLPKRIAVRETVGEDEQAVTLSVEHKHFMNILKMAVYRAETALYRMLAPHYRRNDQEGRALLREAFRASGSLSLHDGYLKVTLEPLSAPRRTRAIAALCREINATATRIPGTSLKLQFDVQSEECLKCA